MLIEFIGSSGSGKSTLLHGVMQFFQQKGVRVYSRWDAGRLYAERSLVGRLTRFAPSPLRDRAVNRVYRLYRSRKQREIENAYPDLIQYVKKSQQNRPPQAGVHQRRILYFYDKMVTQYGVLTALQRSDDVLIFEEGFVNRVVQLNVSAVETPDPLQVIRYLDMTPRPDCLIHIQVPPDICLQRIRQRDPEAYISSLEAVQQERFFSNTQVVIQLAVGHLRQKGWKIIEVDNSQNDPACATAELQEKLRQLPLPKS